MFQQLIKASLPFPVFGLSLVEGAGSGGGDQNKEGEAGNKPSVETVSKVDFERVSKENEKLKQDLEDIKMEIISPEYLDFLNAKETDAGKSSEKPVVGATEEDLSKMTPSQIYAKAKADLEAATKEEVRKLREEISSDSKIQTQREVTAFSRSHSDFEQYRPVMYGMSLDPKFKDASLSELYNAAKEHIKHLQTEPTDAQKDRARRMAGEKPIGASGSFAHAKKYSAEEAALEAWNETVGSDGLPPAV